MTTRMFWQIQLSRYRGRGCLTSRSPGASPPEACNGRAGPSGPIASGRRKPEAVSVCADSTLRSVRPGSLSSSSVVDEASGGSDSVWAGSVEGRLTAWASASKSSGSATGSGVGTAFSSGNNRIISHPTGAVISTAWRAHRSWACGSARCDMGPTTTVESR